MKLTAVITEFIFFYACLTLCSVPAGLLLIGNLQPGRAGLTSTEMTEDQSSPLLAELRIKKKPESIQ